ncbi:MAG TPA: BlaI/MecI/CopY family transcriptional regulator [Pseudonocardiaceae bacterium]|jgi:predicted transcriptional regulator
MTARRSRGSLERDIRDILGASREAMTPAHVRGALGGELAYTTVMTVLGRLYGKGEVTREQVGRGYAYTAIQDSVELAARRMQRLLDAEGADRPAVLMRFVGALAPDDENLLRRVLDT